MEVDWVMVAAWEKTHKSKVAKAVWEEHQKDKLWLTEKARQECLAVAETEWEKVALRAKATQMNWEVSAELIYEVWD